MGNRNLIDLFIENEELDISYLEMMKCGYREIFSKISLLYYGDLSWYDKGFKERMDIYERILLSYKVTNEALEKLEKVNLPKKIIRRLSRLRKKASLSKKSFQELLSQKLGDEISENILNLIIDSCKVGWHLPDVTLMKHADNMTVGPFGSSQQTEIRPHHLPDYLVSNNFRQNNTDKFFREAVALFCLESEKASRIPETLKQRLIDGHIEDLRATDDETGAFVRKEAIAYRIRKTFKENPYITLMLKSDLDFFFVYNTKSGFQEYKQQIDFYSHLLERLKQDVDPVDFVINSKSIELMILSEIPPKIVKKISIHLEKNNNEIILDNRYQLETFLREKIDEKYLSKYRNKIMEAIENRSSFPDKKTIYIPSVYMNYIELAREISKKIKIIENEIRDGKQIINLRLTLWYKEFLAQRGLHMTKLEFKVLEIIKNLVNGYRTYDYPFQIDSVFEMYVNRFKIGEMKLVETNIVPDWSHIQKEYKNPITIYHLVAELAEHHSKTLLDILNSSNFSNPARDRRNNETLELLVEYIRSFEKCYQISEPLYSELTDMKSAVRSLGIMIERAMDSSQEFIDIENRYLENLGIRYTEVQGSGSYIYC